MSVNVFGSSKQVSGGPGRKGQPGIGFKLLDNDGNFDIDSKRLANVAQPVSDNDAVTKVYFNEAISKQESNMNRFRSRLKRYSSQSSRISSIVSDTSRKIDETNSEVDHLKSFCQGLGNNIADIKEQYVTRQSFISSMEANSQMLTKHEDKLNLLGQLIEQQMILMKQQK